MKVEAIIAGHGGQGVLELGNYICYLHMLNGRHAAYTPSYGPESRGGKVKCYVVGSDQEIESPIVEEPDYLIVMNIPSMEYVPMLKKDGTLLMNSSLIDSPPRRMDIRVFPVPATEIAASLGEYGPEGGKDAIIAANSVMFGAYLSLTEITLERQLEAVRDVFAHFLTEEKSAYARLNMEAVRRGFWSVRGTAEGLLTRPQVETVPGPQTEVPR